LTETTKISIDFQQMLLNLGFLFLNFRVYNFFAKVVVQQALYLLSTVMYCRIPDKEDAKVDIKVKSFEVLRVQAMRYGNKK
jgi:hypothetical protein